MGDNISGLKPIALEYLFDGMVLAEDIYNFDGKILLLAKESTITKRKIEKLRQYNTDHPNISVFEETYRTLIGRGLPSTSAHTQKRIEEQTGYTGIKDETADMLMDIKRTNTLSKDSVDNISAQMSKKLDMVDPSILFQCINTPKPIDEYLRRHSVNVGFLNGLLGKWLKLCSTDIDLLVLTGLVHDIGKTKIPTEILDAPRKLTPLEFEIMKKHTVFSYELLNTDERFPESVKVAVRHHHEKMNGSGYPHGLSADKIPLFARITSVSDIYDAMISKRTYKKAHNPFTVISGLAEMQFSDLDIELVRLFTDHMPGELVGKAVLLSDGSIGTVKYIVPGDFEHPLVAVNGEVKKTDKTLYCERIVLEE